MSFLYSDLQSSTRAMMKIVIDNFNIFQITGIASRSAPSKSQSCSFACLLKNHRFVFQEYAGELHIFVSDKDEL